MSKSEELLRLERDLNEQPELKEKLNAECKRIAEAGDAECDGEVLVKAAAALGYTISLEELERLTAAAQELDLDEMNAAGGFDCGVDEKDHELMCLTAWHCFTVTMHTETKKHYASCWKDYSCITVNNKVYDLWPFDD